MIKKLFKVRDHDETYLYVARDEEHVASLIESVTSEVGGSVADYIESGDIVITDLDVDLNDVEYGGIVSF